MVLRTMAHIRPEWRFWGPRGTTKWCYMAPPGFIRTPITTQAWPQCPRRSSWVARKSAFFNQPMQVIFSENLDNASLKRAMAGPRQGQRVQNLSFCILAWVYCHNIPYPRGYHRVTKKPPEIQTLSACPKDPKNPFELNDFQFNSNQLND